MTIYVILKAQILTMPGFEYEKYLKAIKPLPAPPSMAPYLPEIVSSWAEEEYQRFMERPLYPDLSGHVWTNLEDKIRADDNLRQEWGKPSLGGWRKF